MPSDNPVNYRKLDGIVDLSYIFKKNGCGLNDLLNVYKILYANEDKMSSISKEDLKGCDHIVLAMGLDKNRALYFNKSRKLLLNHDDKLE